jgi:hypothetical protein
LQKLQRAGIVNKVISSLESMFDRRVVIYKKLLEEANFKDLIGHHIDQVLDAMIDSSTRQICASYFNSPNDNDSNEIVCICEMIDRVVFA